MFCNTDTNVFKLMKTQPALKNAGSTRYRVQRIVTSRAVQFRPCIDIHKVRRFSLPVFSHIHLNRRRRSSPLTPSSPPHTRKHRAKSNKLSALPYQTSRKTEKAASKPTLNQNTLPLGMLPCTKKTISLAAM